MRETWCSTCYLIEGCNIWKPWRTGAAGGLAGGPQRDEQLHERAPGVGQRAAGVGRCRAHGLIHWPGAPAARAGQRRAPASAGGALPTSMHRLFHLLMLLCSTGCGGGGGGETLIPTFNPFP